MNSKLNIFGLRMFESMILTLQYVSGIAAVVISISTTVFVLSKIFPNPYIPIVAGVALDLAKIISIYVANFNQNQNISTKLLSILWRILLVVIAALFTCITISGMMTNKNLDLLANAEKEQAKLQFDQMLKIEEEDYKARYAVLEEEKKKELVTGAGPRYLQLTSEQEELTNKFQDRNEELQESYSKKLEVIDSKTFSNNKRRNVVLYENFKESFNEAFKVNTSYTFWIFAQVALIALILELTTYIIFDNLASQIRPYIFKLQLQRKLELESYFQIRKNEVEFETEVNNIATESNLQKIENSVEADILAEKFSDGILVADKEISGKMRIAENEAERNLLNDVRAILRNLKAKNKEASV